MDDLYITHHCLSARGPRRTRSSSAVTVNSQPSTIRRVISLEADDDDDDTGCWGCGVDAWVLMLLMPLDR